MRSPVFIVALISTACAVWPNRPAAQLPQPLSAAEISRILLHGPWPQPPRRDPSNRVSANPAAIRLGEQLFFSARLSGTGTVLCASCHETWRHFADGRARALGIEEVDRNTQSVVNVRLQRWFGWTGANDSLWAQSIRPMLDAREMRSDAASIAALLRTDPELSDLYRDAFGAAPPEDSEAALVDVGKALAAYQETLESGRTPFDEFRDALARGDREAAAGYPAPALRGLRIFIGKGDCARCHAGPNFSDGAFHRGGVRSVLSSGEPDTGRQDGIRRLLANPYNLLGRFNDDLSRQTAAGTRGAAAERHVSGAFRTPSLRDVALTAPYMHDGSAATLCDVLRDHPGRPAAADATAQRLAPPEALDLLAFLETLTAKQAARLQDTNVRSCR